MKTIKNQLIPNKPRNAFPGDRVLIMTSKNKASTGEAYDYGTEYVPLTGGIDSVSGKYVMTVNIKGKDVTFSA